MQNPLRVVARIMIGASFVMFGADTLGAPAKRADIAASTLAAVRKVIPLPEDDTVLVQANAAVQVAGGALLALGRAPRLAALGIIGSMIPTTVAGHPFWAIEDPAASAQQRTQFLKNTAMVGGLLMVVLDPH